MKLNIYRLLSFLTVFAFLLSACGGNAQSQPTPDVAAVATSAVQTSEARFTQQALVDLATRVATTPDATLASAEATATATPEATTVSYAYTPGCVFVTYVADVTIPDKMIIAPGETFTKTWRIKNSGSCQWDTTFALVFFSGDKMSEQNSFPLTHIVYPGQEVDVSAKLTAPTTEGFYSSQWRLALPVGTSGVGKGDENLSVSIQVTKKAERYFDVVNVEYSTVREPTSGCTSNGAIYKFYAVVTVNGPGEIEYRWNRMPYDGGKLDGGVLKFKEAGSQTVSWQWTMTADHIQNIDRFVWLEVLGPIPHVYDRVMFNYICKK